MNIANTGAAVPALVTPKSLALIGLMLVLSACAGAPPGGLQVVDGFDINRYDGRWYEIARLDHRFERGLSRVSANYEIQSDDSVRVINRGFNAETEEWEEAIGKARFADTPTKGALEVSFFGPFYGAYNIVELDKTNYQWVLVTGASFDYLWILAREPQLDQAIYQQLLDKARAAGFDTDELIVVQH